MMENRSNIPYLIRLPNLSAYLSKLGGVLNHLNQFLIYFSWWHVSTIDRMKIMEIKIYIIVYSIIISIIVICNNKK